MLSSARESTGSPAAGRPTVMDADKLAAAWARWARGESPTAIAKARRRRDRRAHRAARHREQRLGIPENPRRAAQARPPDRRIHHPPCPQGPENPPGTETAHRHDLAEVPAHPGIYDARDRLLPRGLRSIAPAPVLPVRHGGKQPLRAHPRGHREPGRAVDSAADPQPLDGSG
jgi:hypothetical protein